MAKDAYTERQKRVSVKSVMMIGGIFVFTILVFAMLFGAAEFLAGT